MAKIGNYGKNKNKTLTKTKTKTKMEKREREEQTSIFMACAKAAGESLDELIEKDPNGPDKGFILIAIEDNPGGTSHNKISYIGGNRFSLVAGLAEFLATKDFANIAIDGMCFGLKIMAGMVEVSGPSDQSD